MNILDFTLCGPCRDFIGQNSVDRSKRIRLEKIPHMGSKEILWNLEMTLSDSTQGHSEAHRKFDCSPLSSDATRSLLSPIIHLMDDQHKVFALT